MACSLVDKEAGVGNAAQDHVLVTADEGVVIPRDQQGRCRDAIEVRGQVGVDQPPQSLLPDAGGDLEALGSQHVNELVRH